MLIDFAVESPQCFWRLMGVTTTEKSALGWGEGCEHVVVCLFCLSEPVISFN